ncbi:MAG: hypothetical protein RLZZ126_1798 [Pseudomonadota bacterium]|jgi:16S rRNA (guanine527-N7)-methyltransferase
MLPRLTSGAEALGLTLSETQAGQLLTYLALLQKWNKVYNLTAVRDPVEMLTHHLLDCLTVVQPLARQLSARPERASSSPRLLDVGAGAGLPGVVIAICCPHIWVDCVDTVAKKAAFVNQVAAELKLPNLRGLHARVETLTLTPYDIISARAFSSLGDLVGLTQPLLTPGGCWLAMKGKAPDAELAELEKIHPQVEVFHVEQLQVPGLDASRCIVWMRHRAASRSA